MKNQIETKAIRFKKLAAELMPHMTELQELDDRIDRYDDIDDVMFHKDAYLGGMASVIMAILAKQK